MVAGSGRFPPVLGRRKNASARVYVRAGTGAISVNGSSLVEVGMRRMYVVVLPDGESAGPRCWRRWRWRSGSARWTCGRA